MNKYNKKNISQLVEFVDIYPTLCDLAQIQKPEHLQGNTQVPIIQNAALEGKRAVYFQFLKESYWAVPEGNEQMGYSVLTSDYHYVYWINWDTKEFTADELYDLKNDPHENINIASFPENRDIVEALRKKNLDEQWKDEL